MKVQFNGNGFSAEMENESEQKKRDGFCDFKAIISYSKPLFFAAIAFVLALANLPFGLIINFSSELFMEAFDESAIHLTVLLVSISSIINVISLFSGAFAVSSYFYSERASKDKVGLFFSIFSIAVNVLWILLIVLGLVAW